MGQQRIGGLEGLYLVALGWAVKSCNALMILWIFGYCALWILAGKVWGALTEDAMVCGTALSAICAAFFGIYLLCVL